MVTAKLGLAPNPNSPSEWMDLGIARWARGQFVGALDAFDRAVEMAPERLGAHINRGAVLVQLGRYEEALSTFDEILRRYPRNVDALCNRGTTLQKLDRKSEALTAYEKALMIRPDSPIVLNNFGNALRELGRLDEGRRSLEKAVALSPAYLEALINLGRVLRDLKLPAEAAASFDAALTVNPNNADARLNRGLVALMTGDFERGWALYETRWDQEKPLRRNLKAPYPLWRGQNIRNKRIVVYDEQGMGDTIQFARYLPLLSGQGADVTFLVDPKMQRLLRPLAAQVRLAESFPLGESFDYQCPLMSLPRAMETRSDSIPAAIPYLAAETGKIKMWRERLGEHGFRIGIAWQGNPDGGIDQGRSIPLRCFSPLAAISSIRLISLQKTHGLDQLDDLPNGMPVETLGDAFDGGPDAFVDAAGVMANLDLIVTSDTSIAHLAGALGMPVALVLKRVPEWRWMLDRRDSPWYPTMTLYRQTDAGDWTEPFMQLVADVERQIARDAPRFRRTATL